MDAAAELGRNPVSKILSTEMSRLTRDGIAEPVSQDLILRRERGPGNIHFPGSADHEQDWLPYPVDPSSCYAIHMNTVSYIHTVFVLQQLHSFWSSYVSGYCCTAVQVYLDAYCFCVVWSLYLCYICVRMWSVRLSCVFFL